MSLPSLPVSSPAPAIYAGNIVDIPNRRVFGGTVLVAGGRILGIREDTEPTTYDTYILPGFVDAHVHVESSLLVPSEFARLAVMQGTVATVSDPHEIGNVLGVEGVEYMIENGNTVPFKFYFGAPSCVPATPFETAGAAISVAEVEALLARPEVKYLSEMMNFPGVIQGNADVLSKIAAAHKANKPVDGHAPGLRGQPLETYAAAGVHTDHECFTQAEAEEKLALGMHILIREGSAARNFDALYPLLDTHPDKCMFCTDDKHPNDLELGHINALVRRAVKDHGIDVFNALQAACINPVQHYDLEVGLLRAGDPADFVVVDNLQDFNVLRTIIDGITVMQNGRSLLNPSPAPILNRFAAQPKSPEDFALACTGTFARVIEVVEGQLVTGCAEILAGDCNVDNDVLKIAVVNRYENAPPAVGYIRRFGLKRGAIASSVAHDSHNIIAVGTNDADLCRAINHIIEHQGGLSVACAETDTDAVLPLPVAGIMTNEDGFTTARRYDNLDKLAKTLGTPLAAPFMTLSFMALLVIPSLKMSDKGLFDGDTFRFVDVFTGDTGA